MGKLQRAQDRVARAEGVKTVNTKTEESGEAKKIAELEAEVKRLKLIQSGELDTETGSPSGGTLSDAEFNKLWGSGALPSTKANFERALKIQSRNE